jgi:hypothetical protein
MSAYVDYWVQVKHRARLPKPYTWEIRSSGHAPAVRRSYVPFKNEVMARVSGERALRRLLRKLNSRSPQRAPRGGETQARERSAAR